MFRAPCAHRQEVKIVLYSLWYHHTYRWSSPLSTCALDGHLRRLRPQGTALCLQRRNAECLGKVLHTRADTVVEQGWRRWPPQCVLLTELLNTEHLQTNKLLFEDVTFEVWEKFHSFGGGEECSLHLLNPPPPRNFDKCEPNYTASYPRRQHSSQYPFIILHIPPPPHPSFSSADSAAFPQLLLTCCPGSNLSWLY